MRSKATSILGSIVLSLSLGALGACSDDDDADSLGVGAECAASDECDIDNGQSCITDFKGGYCGIEDCVADIDCPDNSACVAHDNNTNYCFRTCTDKAQCNENRSAENESNCSASIVFVETQDSTTKACVPPSG